MYTEVEKAYLAGFLDGEGHIGITKAQTPRTGGTHTHMVIVTVSNTYLPLMEKLQRRWGGTLVKRKACKTSEKIIGNLRWSSRAAAAVLHELEPYIVVKKQQLEIALAFADELANREYHAKPLTEDEWRRREELRMAIRALNGGVVGDTEVRPAPTFAPKVCANCGKPIETYERLSRKYCSIKCARRARYLRNKAQIS